MAKRTLLTLILAVTTAASGGWAWLEHSHSAQREAAILFDQKRLALVEAENERLRGVVERSEKAAREAVETAIRVNIEKKTAQLRSLPFKKAVGYNVVTRKGVVDVLHQKFSEQLSDAEFEGMRLGYVAMGLIPADFPLKQRYIDLLSEQIAAFYDQHSHQLFMFDGASLENAQNRVILAHELTHALQDQHFVLAKMPLELKTNDDRAIAASSLIEGDATLLMQLFMAQDISIKGIGQTLGGMFTQNMEQLVSAPRIMRESLLFPYTKGLEFCLAIQKHPGDFKTISEAFARPPSSTTQILHPEKYLACEEPIPVIWPDLSVLGEPPIFDNVLGEFGTRILLADWIDEAAAEKANGWRGDRYLVFQNGQALAWRTVWSDEATAEGFAATLQQLLIKRYNATPLPDSQSLTAKDRTLKLIRKEGEATVILVDARDAKWAEALAGKFAR